MNNLAIQKNHWTLFLCFLLLSVYGVIYYLVLTYQSRIDFSSFYSAAQALSTGENPYLVLLTTYFPIVKKLSANLNPPATLWLILPIARLNYFTAVSVWSACGFVSGVIGAGIAFKYAFTPEFLKKHWLHLYLAYFALFFVMIDTFIAQLGSFLLFFLMSGYHFYIKKNNVMTGLLWGTIIAMKLFPALLFIYVLVQKRYKALCFMMLVFLLLTFIPLFIYGTTVYAQYFSTLSRVLWYGDNWNASFYGFIFRLCVDRHLKSPDLTFVHVIYCLFFASALVWYIIRIQTNNHHREFCLTVVMMLLMSPLGWLYYFPLLVFPLSLIYLKTQQTNPTTYIGLIWLICLFLITFPIDYMSASRMNSLIQKLTIFSFHFYGLLLLAYLTDKINVIRENSMSFTGSNHYLIPASISIFSFSVLVMISSFFIRFFS